MFPFIEYVYVLRNLENKPLVKLEVNDTTKTNDVIKSKLIAYQMVIMPNIPLYLLSFLLI